MVHSHAMLETCTMTHLNAVFSSLLQVRNDGMVPEIDKPRPKILNRDWTREEEAGTYSHTDHTHK